jgi:hypothetical protein
MGVLGGFAKAKPVWHEFREVSFLPTELKQQFHALLTRRFTQLEGEASSEEQVGPASDQS